MITISLPAHVSRVIREHRLFNPGEIVIVALSGGADSCVLLDILAGMKEMRAHLVVAHLNHCLRGAESDGDERFCRELAGQYALPFESRRIDVAELARRKRLNLEDAGRRARLAFLDEIRTTHQASVVALAHHADDQAETVLMRLLRGSGGAGLSGMSFRSENHRIRPLLSTSRRDIESYLNERGLKYREDSSNRDTSFLRNRIRHELLPLLTGYNPAIRERLAATAELLGEENNLLEQLAFDLSTRVCSISDNRISFFLSRLENQPKALKRRLFRQALATLAGDGDHFSMSHILAIDRLAASSHPNASLNLPRGITALREYGALHLQKSSREDRGGFVELEIAGPGCYFLSDGSHVTISKVSTMLQPATLTATTALLDLDKAPFPWRIRSFRPGDRIQPLGMTGSKKIKDLFIDLKIPHGERKNIPLLFCDDALLWVCGIRPSRLAAVDGRSQNLIMAVYSKQAGIPPVVSGKQSPFFE